MSYARIPLHWRALLAAFLGWMLDGMDVMLYAFALPQIQREFALNATQAGSLASITLLAAALGGSVAGYIADRFGRTRALMLSVLLYSVFTALCATARSYEELLVWRALVGLGLGAEWSAGTVLVAEWWPPQHRGKAVGFTQSGWALGYIAAALLAAATLPTYGWRPLFAIGVLPALLVFWIRRNVQEPPAWQESQARQQSDTPDRSPFPWRSLALAVPLSSFVLFAYWGLFTWLPAFLAAPVGKGGAGLSIVQSANWTIPVQLGALLGYWTFGFMADGIGRRTSFSIFTLGAALIVPIYGLYARDLWILTFVGPLVGFFGHGYFGVFGALMTDLFPTSVRGLAQGLAYNLGRVASAFAPAVVGWVASNHGFPAGLALTAAVFACAAAWVWLLPRSRPADGLTR